MFENIMMMDQGILLWIQDVLRNDFLTPIFTFITRLGDAGAIWIVISIGLLFHQKTRKIGIMALCSLVAAFIIDNMILKNLIGRIRPYEMLSGLECLIDKPNDFSFPSGHTGSSFAVASILLLGLPKKYGIPAMILAALIGFSRLYVGVHYPTDVLCGAIIGIMIACIVYCVGMLVIDNSDKILFHRGKKI